METTISVSPGFFGKNYLKKTLLFCGMLSSLLYVAMNIFVPMLFEGYSFASQIVSELSAIGAPTRRLWVVLGSLYTLLVALFGWGIWKAAGRNRALRVVAVLLVVYGVIGLFWPPMHQREVLAAGGKSLTDTLHIVWTVITVFLMVLAIGFGASAFGKPFRRYSIATLVVLVIFGGLTATAAPNVEANLPTPWIGVWERINIGVFLLWVFVLAVVLLRKEKFSGSINR